MAKKRQNAWVRFLLQLVVLLAGWTVAGQSLAQWQVTDAMTHSGLDTANAKLDGFNNKQSTTNDWLDKQYRQQNIGSAGRSTDANPDDPGLALQKDQLSYIGGGRETRCPQLSASTTATHQQTVCQEIVDTEVAQYNYALTMRQVAVQRQTRLGELENERAGLSPATDAGKLQTNSNELLALIARAEVDRQQYRTYMDAYETRLHYLRSLQDSLGSQAINGSTEGNGGIAGKIIGAAVALGALDAALQLQKTSKRGSFQDYNAN